MPAETYEGHSRAAKPTGAITWATFTTQMRLTPPALVLWFQQLLSALTPYQHGTCGSAVPGSAALQSSHSKHEAQLPQLSWKRSSLSSAAMLSAELQY